MLVFCPFANIAGKLRAVNIAYAHINYKRWLKLWGNNYWKDTGGVNVVENQWKFKIMHLKWDYNMNWISLIFNALVTMQINK